MLWILCKYFNRTGISYIETKIDLNVDLNMKNYKNNMEKYDILTV